MDKTCDIVILGGGGSGLAAAARAADISDKKVIVIEKADFLGGGAIQAADFRVYDSQWQKDRGLDDSMETDLIKYMDETYWKLDPKLVGNTFKATGRFFDWLCTFSDDVAGRYKPGRYIFDMPDRGPVIPAYDGSAGGRGGTYATKLLIKKAQELGVELLLKTKVIDLEVTEGKVTAVIAEQEDKQIKIGCKACILATGSWINHQDILEKVHPKYAAIDPGPLQKGGHRSSAYTGDGIALAEKVGAYIDYDSFCLRLMGPLTMAPGKTLSAMSNHPYSLQVNLLGKRYVCEPSQIRLGLFDSGHILAEQPEGIAFVVFDENTAKAAAEADKLVDKTGYGGFFGFADFPEDVVKDLEDTRLGRIKMGGPGGPPPAEGEGGPVGGPGGPGGEEKDEGPENGRAPMQGQNMLMYGETIAELAEKMGVPANALEQTITHYNECCEAGFDDDFFKPAKNLVPLTGPYYALRCNLGTDGAFGGVLVNADMQAYAKDGGLVEGFYCTGDFASGRFVNDMGVKRQVINDLSWAYASGFMAGENAVKYLG